MNKKTMQIFHSISEIQNHLKSLVRQGKTVGFVPTMGALHAGHLALVETAKANNDIAVCSIFVNPTQFNNAHDLAVYPRTLSSDNQLLETVNCDYIFAPSAEEMYSDLPNLKFDFGDLERVMEGEFRPGHFNGVGIVVSKLFHIIKPDRAYFGQKDLQQCAVVRRLIHDLSFDLTLIICPTHRETDGLAMSSRNRNLTEEQRNLAPNLYKTMNLAKEKLLAGEDVQAVKMFVQKTLSEIQGIDLEYFEVSNLDNLKPINDYIAGKTAFCIAAFLGKTRLIDNLIF
jgi:pantoate--beta-alanine ligase